MALLVVGSVARKGFIMQSTCEINFERWVLLELTEERQRK